VAIKQDVTKRKLLESQLRQAQKMEAIGQLAGGVVHDFNNILAVIQLQAGLLKNEQALSEMQLDMANEIERAARRAANLTHQLLLFSRKKAQHLRDENLNEVVISITKMLQRVHGEDVLIQFRLSAQPLFVHADTGMLDQVQMNLTVNARDAMPGGGQLSIETSAVEFDKVTAAQTSSARPGSFACVSVTDTGCGMSAEVPARIWCWKKGAIFLPNPLKHTSSRRPSENVWIKPDAAARWSGNRKGKLESACPFYNLPVLRRHLYCLGRW